MTRQNHLKIFIFLTLLTLVLPHCGPEKTSAPQQTSPTDRHSPTMDPPRFLERSRDVQTAESAVIAIHGLGDRPDHFSSLFHGFPKNRRVLFPRGPKTYRQGFSWFDIDIPYTDKQPNLAKGIARAADQIAALIRTQIKPSGPKPIVTGFSQGGAVSFAIAVLHPQLIQQAVPVSGALPTALLPKVCTPSMPPIRALHGRADTIVPFEAANTTISRLQKLGCDATLDAYKDVGHTIHAKMRDRLFSYLKERH